MTRSYDPIGESSAALETLLEGLRGKACWIGLAVWVCIPGWPAVAVSGPW
jgi:hypothetical protein